MTPERQEAIRSFLSRAGWEGRPFAPLAGDASPRRYYRLGAPSDAPARRAVLMDDEQGGRAAVGRFAALSEHLGTLGFRAPDVLAADLDRGLLLIGDLGDDLLTPLLARAPALERPCYEAAIDVLAELGRHPPPASVRHGGETHRIRPYDLAPLLDEASLVVDWWIPGAGREADEDAVAEFRQVLTEALERVASCRDVLVLRDFHADNLIWLGREETRACRRIGLLDFQDALAGHPAYDLVSLLEDARRDTSPALRSDMLERYLRNAGLKPDRHAEFRAACAALGAQRNLKIIGIFARLCIRDGKPTYLDFTPRVWNHLLSDLAHPALRRLGGWVRRHVPAPTLDVRSKVRARCGPG